VWDTYRMISITGTGSTPLRITLWKPSCKCPNVLSSSMAAMGHTHTSYIGTLNGGYKSCVKDFKCISRSILVSLDPATHSAVLSFSGSTEGYWVTSAESTASSTTSPLTVTSHIPARRTGWARFGHIQVSNTSPSPFATTSVAQLFPMKYAQWALNNFNSVCEVVR